MQRSKKIGRKWSIVKVFFLQHDNATSHTSLTTRQKSLRPGLKVMLHPQYKPDLAPSDYYLFRFLQNSLNGKTFNDDEAVKSHLVQFFADKDQKFYERGIMKLPERWQRVIEQNGKYIIDYSSFFAFNKMCLFCMQKSAISSGTIQYIIFAFSRNLCKLL